MAYLDAIPKELINLLKETDFCIIPKITLTYAHIFDWFMNQNIDVEVYVSMTQKSKTNSSISSIKQYYTWIINTPTDTINSFDDTYDWFEAANEAIRKAIEYIK